MVDISKCEGTDCPLKNDCYRYRVKASDMQYYIAPPYDPKIEKCEYFFPIGDRKVKPLKGIDD